MANLNIVNVASILGNTAQITPGSGASAAWTIPGTGGTNVSVPGLTAPTGGVNRVTGIVVSNTTSSAATATVAVGNNPTFASSTTTTYLAYQVTVPPNASVIISDKTTSFYITENQSVAVISGTANALTFTASFEAIS